MTDRERGKRIVEGIAADVSASLGRNVSGTSWFDDFLLDTSTLVALVSEKSIQIEFDVDDLSDLPQTPELELQVTHRIREALR